MDIDSVRNLLVPVISVLAIPAVFIAAYYFRYKTRCDLQETLRMAIQSGQELTPEALERIGGPPAPKNADLRRGVIIVAIGLSLIAFSLVSTSMGDGGTSNLRAGGVMALVIGFAFLALWRFGDDKR